MSKVFYLVGYDIASDKERSKVASVMEAFGYRVQYSLFECRLNGRDFGEMIRRLSPHIKKKHGDSLRIYRLCEACVPRILRYGDSEDPWERPERIF